MTNFEELIHSVGLNLQSDSIEFYELLNLFLSIQKEISNEPN
jgi:hypothetical protein